MTVRTKSVILCFKYACECAHQCAAFTCKVAVNLFFKSSWKQIPCADGYAQRFCPIQCFASCILVNSEAAVYAAAVNKVSAHTSTAAFRCNKDDIDIFGWDNACLLFVNDAKTVAEV